MNQIIVDVPYTIYAAPNGPTSTGVCKLCGKRGKGANSITQEFLSPIGKAGRKGPEQNKIKAGRAKYISDAKQMAHR